MDEQIEVGDQVAFETRSAWRAVRDEAVYWSAWFSVRAVCPVFGHRPALAQEVFTAHGVVTDVTVGAYCRRCRAHVGD